MGPTEGPYILQLCMGPSYFWGVWPLLTPPPPRISHTVADSYINSSANSAGAAAEMAASRKSAKYADLPDSARNAWSNEFFGYGIIHCSGPQNQCVFRRWEREGCFLFQRLSMALQRYNAILLHESFVGEDDPDLELFQIFLFNFFSF